MKSKKKSLLTSLLAIVLCLSLITGSTFALFTSTDNVDITVKSGKVKISATVDDLKLYSATIEETEDEAGTIETGNHAATYYYEEVSPKFTNDGTAVYSDGTLTLDRVTPGDKVTFKVGLTNSSNVNIKYRVVVTVTSGLKLFRALKVKIDGSNLTGVSRTGNWTSLEAGGTINNIPVEIYMPIDLDGEEYMDISTAMRITVEAVQGNAKTTDAALTTAVEAIAETATTVDSETKKTTAATEISDSDSLVTVTIPANTTLTAEDDTSLAVKVTPQDTVSNITVLSTQASASYDVSVLLVVNDVVTDQKAVNNSENEEEITVKMFIGTGLTGVQLYHGVEEIEYDDYNSETGYITFKTTSFSEYTVVYNKDFAYETFDENGNSTGITVLEATETAGFYEDTVNGGVVTVAEDANGNVTTTSVFASGKGMEKDPYIISSDFWWKKFVELTANDSDFSETAGKYFKVTTDLDVTAYGTDRANIHYFAGSIDFANHTFTGITAQNAPASDVGDDGITAIFSRIQGNVTISNLNFVTTKVVNGSHTVAAQVTGRNTGNVNVDFNNITISGTVTGANINNNGLLISYVFNGEANISLVNCNSYANIVGSGYKSVFLGNMGYGSVKTITATNCHNYGTIVSTNAEASMFIANAGYMHNSIIVTISNCSNEGEIGQNTTKARYNLVTTRLDSSYQYVVNGYNLSQMTDSAFNSAVESELSGSLVYTITSGELAVNEGKFVLNANENAVKYALSFSFYAGGHAAGGGAGYGLTFTPAELAAANIMAYTWIDKQDATAEIEAHNEYGTTYYTSGDHYVFYSDDSYIRDNVFVTFIAYGENDTVLSITTYQYSE